MAVVQISKIQLRRGLKSLNGSIPQLSSAEMAWAVDTQELYIGNGSVAEGAPYVGNTKVLTEHDNILELASSYEFASDDLSITKAIPRSLQSKADETVSVADFGAVADGSTDNKVFFENAFEDLFQNTDTNYRKVLRIPNGVYNFSQDLEIPSNVILEGETRDGVILDFDTNNIRIVSENGTVTNFTSTDRPENIKISNLTITRSSGQTVLSGGYNIELTGVKFLGEYFLGNPVDIAQDPGAVYWVNVDDGDKTDKVTFTDCIFENNAIGVKCIPIATDETGPVLTTEVNFRGCSFIELHTGIYILGNATQQNSWNLEHSTFEEIAQHAFFATAGTGTHMQHCDFKNCGNGTGAAGYPQTSIVSFGESAGNTVLNCTSNRQQSVTALASDTKVGITEVYNGDAVSFVDRVTSPIFKGDETTALAVFSTDNKHIRVNYTLKMSSEIRVGKITMAIDDDYSHVSMTDEYQYSSSLGTGTRGELMTNFTFSATLEDNTRGDDESTLSDMIDTVVLSYRNPQESGETGTISFDVSYGV